MRDICEMCRTFGAHVQSNPTSRPYGRARDRKVGHALAALRVSFMQALCSLEEAALNRPDRKVSLLPTVDTEAIVCHLSPLSYQRRRVSYQPGAVAPGIRITQIQGLKARSIN
jgi:hypothetical protein